LVGWGARITASIESGEKTKGNGHRNNGRGSIARVVMAVDPGAGVGIGTGIHRSIAMTTMTTMTMDVDTVVTGARVMIKI